jgi:hypothetical protein
MDEKSRDPLIGEELIRIVLERYEIELRFSRETIQIGAIFLLKGSDGVVATVDPTHREGNLSPLWRLVGKKVERASLGETISLAFDDGSTLEIPPSPGRPRGAFLGGDDKTYIFEEF